MATDKYWQREEGYSNSDWIELGQRNRPPNIESLKSKTLPIKQKMSLAPKFDSPKVAYFATAKDCTPLWSSKIISKDYLQELYVRFLSCGPGRSKLFGGCLPWMLATWCVFRQIGVTHVIQTSGQQEFFSLGMNLKEKYTAGIGWFYSWPGLRQVGWQLRVQYHMLDWCWRPRSHALKLLVSLNWRQEPSVQEVVQVSPHGRSYDVHVTNGWYEQEHKRGNQTTSDLIQLSWGTKTHTPYNFRLTWGYNLSTIQPTFCCRVLL